MPNPISIKHKIWVALAIPMLLVVINSVMMIVLVQKQQAFSAYIIEESTRNQEVDVAKAMQDFSRMGERVKRMVILNAVMGILIILPIAFLIIRSIRMNTDAENLLEVKNGLSALQQQIEALNRKI